MEFQDANLSEMLRLIGAHHDEAERQVLSMMLMDSGVALEIARGEVETDEGTIEINEDFFFNNTYKFIYLSVCDLVEKASAPMDSFTICARAMRLAAQNKVKTNVNRQLIEDLRKLKPEGTLYGSLSLLQNKKYMREFVLAATWAMQNAKPDVDVRELVPEYLEKIMKLIPLAQNERCLEGNKAVQYHLQVMEERIAARRAGKLIELDYPWQSWRNVILPQVPGKYMSLVIPQGQGKSTYCGNIAEYRAVNKIHTITMLLEDTKKSFWDRTSVRWSGFSMDKIRGGKLTDEEFYKYKAAMEKVDKFAEYIHLEECSGMTASQVLRELRRWKMKRPEIMGAHIDHVGAFSADRWHAKLQLKGHEAQGEDAQSLVNFSTEYGVPLLVLDQVNKDGEKAARDGDMFTTSQYGSSKKGWAADTIVTATRMVVKGQDEYWNNNLMAKVGELSTKVNVKVTKQNNGPSGVFTQRYDYRVYRIKDEQQPVN